MAKRYLGDGVYVDHDGHMLKLTTAPTSAMDGSRSTNIIYLEPSVLAALQRYVETLEHRLHVEGQLTEDSDE